MDFKFSHCVFVEMEADTFSEFPTLEELKEDFGEDYVKKLVGYFPAGSNVTYSELKDFKEEKSWTVAYHDKNGHHILVSFSSTLDLKRKLDSIIKVALEKDYVAIFKNEDIVYLV